MTTILSYLQVMRRLRQGRPTLLSFNVSNRCNERCPMCNVWRTPSADLSLADMETIFSDLKRFGIRVVEISGGEPFLREDLPEVIRLLDRLGFLFTISTNGTVWRDDVVAALRAARGLMQVAVSLDSLKPEVYARLRGVAALPTVVANIDRLARTGFEAPVKINFTMSRHNFSEFFQVLDFARRRRLYLSVFPANFGTGRYHSAGDDVMAAGEGERLGMARIFRQLVTLRRMGEPLWEFSGFYELCADFLEGKPLGACGAGSLYLDLHADGHLAICLEREPFADLRTESVADVWTRMEAARADVAGCAAETPCCYTCTYNVALTARHPFLFALETALVRLRMRLHGR